MQQEIFLGYDPGENGNHGFAVLCTHHQRTEKSRNTRVAVGYGNTTPSTSSRFVATGVACLLPMRCMQPKALPIAAPRKPRV